MLMNDKPVNIFYLNKVHAQTAVFVGYFGAPEDLEKEVVISIVVPRATRYKTSLLRLSRWPHG